THFSYRLFQHLLVELEPDFLDVPRLLFPEQVAGTADVEVVTGQLKARAERVERLQHLQTALSGRRKLLVDRQCEQGEGAHLRASDTPSQLVELRQAEHVGAVNDQRVRRWNVETGF